MSDQDRKNDPARHDDEAGRAVRSDDLGKRLESLNAKVDQRKAEEKAKQEPSTKGDGKGMAMAFRLSSEFVAGIVVGAAIGYAVDTFFGTSPWGMIIFFLLGFVTAILNVLRASGMVAESQLHLHKVREIADDQPSGDDGAKKKN